MFTSNFTYYDPNTVIEINPTQLTSNPTHVKVLRHFLLANKDTSFFEKDTTYDIKVDGKQYAFTLTHDILNRKREHAPDQDRFEVIENCELGKGNFGSYYRIAGTLEPTLEGGLHFSNKNRGVKVKKKEPTSDKYEYQQTKPVKYSHVKQPVIVQNSNHREYMVMRHLPGIDLLAFLCELYNQNKSLTESQRLSLSIKLLRQLQEEIHDRGVLHLDLKPENIKYDVNTGEVNIFDFGLSVAPGVQRETVGGTPNYAPLEQRQEDVNQLDGRSDVYSIGKVLSMVWEMPFINTNGSYYVETQFSFRPNFQTFSNHQSIRDTIQKMTRTKKEDRISLEKAIEQFELMRVQLEHGSKNPDELNKIKTSMLAGLTLWKAMREAKKHDATTAGSLMQLVKLQLNAVPDESDCVKAFIESSGIASFAGLQTTQEVQDKITSIETEFQTNKKKFLEQLNLSSQIIKQLDSKNNSDFYSLMKSINSNLQSAYNKSERLSPGIDEMVELNNKITKSLQKTETMLSKQSKKTDGGLSYNIKDVAKKLLEIPTMNTEQSDSSLARLRKLVKQAVVMYLDAAYTKETAQKKTRAASQDRLQDVCKLLDIVNSSNAQSATDMITALQAYLKTVKRGLFHTNSFFLRHIGSSKLADNIQNAINFYRKVENKPRNTVSQKV